MKVYERNGIHLIVGSFELPFYRLMSSTKCSVGHKLVKRKVGGKRYSLPHSNCSVFCADLNEKELKSILTRTKRRYNQDLKNGNKKIDRKAEAWFKKHGFRIVFDSEKKD